MLTEKTFDTGTVKINYAEGPPNGVPLILLHGTTSIWQTYNSVLPLLLYRYHTYALDQRGHGRSSRAPNVYGIDSDAEDVVTFLHTQVAEPAILLGHSGGAITAILVATQVPALVRAIVLEDPPLSELNGTGGSGRYVEFFKNMRNVMTMDGSMNDKLAALAATMPNADAVDIRFGLKCLIQCDPEIATQCIETKYGAQYRCEDLLPQIVCPVLLIQGNPKLGGALTAEEIRFTLPLIADCTNVFWEDLGHGIHAKQPVRFAHTVMRFLESL